jgi:hypothetical protein
MWSSTKRGSGLRQSGSLSSFYRRFSPGRAKIFDKKQVKYLAAAGKSDVAGATA